MTTTESGYMTIENTILPLRSANVLWKALASVNSWIGCLLTLRLKLRKGMNLPPFKQVSEFSDACFTTALLQFTRVTNV